MIDISFGRETLSQLDECCKREWLETNGLGGFASSTIAGMNTRRYHGLLVAATKPPVGRTVMLSRLEETAIVEGREYALGTNSYPGAVHPRGFELLESFRLAPFPVFTFEAGGVEIEKSLFMVHGENTTVIRYQVRGPGGCELFIRPLIAFRDYHSLTHHNEALHPEVVREGEVVKVSPYPDLPPLYLSCSSAEMTQTGDWYYRFQYEAEAERGLDFEEDLFNPCQLRFTLGARGTADLIASTMPTRASRAAAMERNEIDRRRRLVAAAPSGNPLVESLTAAAEQYIVDRGASKTIIAGYHWFSDWGRDSMIALPGLTLATNRHNVAREVLLTFAGHLDRGMLPNRFPDAGESPEYNTADATLWMFEAARAYVEQTSDHDFVRQLYPRFKEVIDWHLKGTRYGIRVDTDGLLRCGEPGVQLTWMDAKVGDTVITPRHGKPVEIQALWYNALLTQASFAAQVGDSARALFLNEFAGMARASFTRKFWNEESGCLFDVVNGDEVDQSVRPNQILAVSLHHPLVEGEHARRLVALVERELLTPLGLRSLAQRDPAYRPTYEGGVWSRDSAYHQGTVWPWLIGPFIDAYLRVHEHSDTARQRVREILRHFESHLKTGGLNHISEIADAVCPHTPKGCIAQAWSVAEVLRSAVTVAAAAQSRIACATAE